MSRFSPGARVSTRPLVRRTVRAPEQIHHYHHYHHHHHHHHHIHLVHGGVLMQGSDLAGEVVHHPHGVEVGERSLTAAKTTRQKLDDTLQTEMVMVMVMVMVMIVMVTSCQ